MLAEQLEVRDGETGRRGDGETSSHAPTLPRSLSPIPPFRRVLAPIAALCRRELLKFTRDRSRVLGALIQPIGLWLLLGLGFQSTFRLPGAGGGTGYLEFLFPGVIAMVLLFTAIFSTISIVDERRTGFLQAALVAPMPRAVLVLGSVLGGTLLATAEAALFLLLLPALGLSYTVAGLAFVLLISFLVGLAFTALGFAIAWRMESTRGYHSMMTILLFPLWFLSGAPFPAEGASPLLQGLMAINPVSYTVSGLRQALYGFSAAAPVQFAPAGLSLLITALFAALMLALAVYTVRRPLHGA